jgi:RHS repeat-associated protein
MKQNEQYYFYHNDHLDTPMLITNDAGAAVWSAYYDVFGKVNIYSSSLITNNLRFPGQYYDFETEFNYNYFRNYASNLGRYLTPDPIGIDGKNNYYNYANQNPVNYYDPYGLAAATATAITFCAAQPEICAILSAWILYELQKIICSDPPRPSRKDECDLFEDAFKNPLQDIKTKCHYWELGYNIKCRWAIDEKEWASVWCKKPECKPGSRLNENW